jgi:putative toxin-antitoxin system antitoxin component (TIGR02293 family)
MAAAGEEPDAVPKSKDGSARHHSPSLDRYWAMYQEGQLVGHYYALLLGIRTTDTARLLGKVRAGLPFSCWERFQHHTELPTGILLELVQITSRTLSRRKEEGKLRPDESDRLLRASRIFARVLELFEGDVEGARDWLLRNNTALGGSPPLSYSSTEIGALEVEALIGRLEHGIPS